MYIRYSRPGLRRGSQPCLCVHTALPERLHKQFPNQELRIQQVFSIASATGKQAVFGAECTLTRSGGRRSWESAAYINK